MYLIISSNRYKTGDPTRMMSPPCCDCSWPRLLCLLILLILLFSAYESEYVTETVRLSITRAAATPDPSNSFVCLANDAQLWTERRNISNQYALSTCNNNSSFKRLDSTIPILVVTWDADAVPFWEYKRPTFHRMITTSLNTAAEFNDHVILLNLGSPVRHKLHGHVETVYVDSSIQHALDSFDVPLYQHHSSNDFKYELLCFKRWFAIASLMQERNVSHVFVMDGDVLLFTNVTMQVERCFPTCQTVGQGCYSTYMTQSDVVSFVQFIVQYFQRGDFQLELTEFGVVSDMILHLRWQQSIHIASRCTANVFDGSFYADVKQDALGMPYQTDSNRRPLSLHFSQGFRKAVLEYCESYY